MPELVTVQRIDRVLSKLEYAFSVLANVGMILMMALIAANTFLRYVFLMPISGMQSVVSLYLMPLAIFFTAAILQRHGGNINVDLLKRKFPTLLDEVVNLIAQVGALWLFGLLAYLTWDQAITRLGRGATLSGVIELPTGVSWLFITLGLALLSVRLLLQISETVASIVEHVQSDPVGVAEESA
jgi:TRAP-type C4-dicarboxylate transport system permease small subunit